TTAKISKVRKRNGNIVDFEQRKITDAINKAFLASSIEDEIDAKRISDIVENNLNNKFRGKTPSVEDIQDIVVEVLKEEGYQKIAAEYEAYREKKEEIRRIQKNLSIEEEPKLTVNSLEVLKKRYLLKNDKEEIVETPSQMFRRVAKAIAKIDEEYHESSKKTEDEFYEIMSKLEFLPNSPTLFNAGTGTNFGLSACYVLPVDDSLEGIFDTVEKMALIEQGGGGVGFDFSRLRPTGDLVKSTKGVASGPVSFMRVFDTATDVIKAGGKRRGAMMAMLRVDHPDILEFISVKSKPGMLTNFNISVSTTDDFMNRVEKNQDYDLVNPRTKESVRKISAKFVWDQLVENAWKSGDPGVVFIDEVNRYNPTPAIGLIEATNPCGEQPLLPYESCNLGSVNLSRMLTERGEIDWEKIRRIIHIGVHFLDNVIDANVFPVQEIYDMTKGNRKIGIGIMGFAELLIRLGIPYDSQQAVDLGERIAHFFSDESGKASTELAMRRGSFPNFEKSIWKDKTKARRNATVTTIAPTGTISIIAGCSSGIEPLFAVAFMRHVLEGARLFELNPLFERTAKDKGFYSAELMGKIAKSGTLKGVEEVPEDVRKIFVTSHDISPQWHVRIQAAFQKYTENAVSKTVNLPHDATVRDVEEVYRLAYKLRCKGVTVYRYGSKGEQVLNLGVGDEKAEKYMRAEAEYAGGIPTITCQV
ncbi:MAG: adenosylcobalamin-dependent ribonucleoside-diphosphate reductase, partial [Candidatus Bathyarchaeota archaeon]